MHWPKPTRKSKAKMSNELIDSLRFTQKDVDTVRIMVSENNDAGIQNLENSISEIKNQITYLENQSRRCNIRVDGITESSDEDWNETEQKLKATLVQQLKLDQESNIERAHRTSPKRNNDGSPRTRPRTIVCKLYDWKKKEYLVKRAKEVKPPGLYVNEDLAKETIRKRKELMSKLIEARRQGKLAYFHLDRLVIKTRR